VLKNWIAAFTSSIGMKIVMALSGLGLVLFIFVHMLGNLELFGGQNAINQYGAALRVVPPLLWAFRLGLFVLVVAHIASGVRLALLNRRARPVGYARKKNLTTGIAARTMIWTGVLIGIFVTYHILHFTVRSVEPAYAHMQDAQGRHDVFGMVTDAFRKQPVAAGYVVAMLFLGLHVSHGFGSMFQTLGASHPRYHQTVRRIGPVFAVLIVLGFISVPLAVFLGWVQPGSGGH
jgi:succinate dehydrogenase / fumarate reductase cytochrome b subunit